MKIYVSISRENNYVCLEQEQERLVLRHLSIGERGKLVDCWSKLEISRRAHDGLLHRPSMGVERSE